MKVETDIITSIAESLLVQAVILELIYVETEVIVFTCTGSIIRYLTSLTNNFQYMSQNNIDSCY